MSLDRATREKLVRALAESVIQHADELTSLDQAIGDGDHGLNMKRGFEAVLATLPALADKPMPEMLKAIGTSARLGIEKMVGTKVFLELFVKVRAGWRDSRQFVEELDWRRQMLPMEGLKDRE